MVFVKQLNFLRRFVERNLFVCDGCTNGSWNKCWIDAFHKHFIWILIALHSSHSTLIVYIVLIKDVYTGVADSADAAPEPFLMAASAANYWFMIWHMIVRYYELDLIRNLENGPDLVCLRKQNLHTPMLGNDAHCGGQFGFINIFFWIMPWKQIHLLEASYISF